MQNNKIKLNVFIISLEATVLGVSTLLKLEKFDKIRCHSHSPQEADFEG